MRYRKLGRTDIEVSVVAMGCWGIAGGRTWGDQDHHDAIDAIHAALDCGINFFDTAPAYGGGESEELLAEALKGKRDKAIIADKISPDDFHPEGVRASTETSLKTLATDVIDLMQLHWPNWDVPLADTLGALDELKAEGKIRAIGVSNFGKRDLTEAAGLTSIATNQLAYSLIARGIEYEIQPLCMEHQIGILCYSPLAQGLLTGKFRSANDVPDGRARTRHFSSKRPETRHGEEGCENETFEAIDKVRQIAEEVGQTMGNVSLAWLLAQPAVTSVLAGARNREQAQRNAEAADIELNAITLTRLKQATDEVRAKLGPRADLWTSKDENRMR